MTLYGRMECPIRLVLKSMALSYTPDLEHILEIAMCSRNKQSLYELFQLHKENYIRDAHATCHLDLTYSIFMLFVFST